MRTDPRNGDPRLKTRQWRAIVNAWTRLQPVVCEATPCLLPTHPITYTPTRTRTSLDVGHKIPRAIDQRTTWTIDDTRPEHQYCSRSHGNKIKTQIKNRNTIPTIKKEEQARSAKKW
jgi:hypothetical protein